MTIDINEKAFDEKTLLKLDIFRECFREWFPVFLHNSFVDRIYIMDMFAGSGTDIEGNYGSPLILLDEVKGSEAEYCKHAENGKRDILFWFNEALSSKAELLKTNIDSYISNCEQECSLNDCYIKNRIKVTQEKFEDVFKSDRFIKIASNRSFGKFLVLDQYGFKQVGDEEFKCLIKYQKLDFIFFVTSHAIRRFKNHDNVNKHIKSSDIEFDDNPKLTHQQIANHYRSLIPEGVEYYVHHFSIIKGANRYGLIFGSGHTLGMEKFLTTCWKKDPYAGESDEMINSDYEYGTLFAGTEPLKKKEQVKNIVKKNILEGTVYDNISGLKLVLQHGCLGDVYLDAVNELKTNELIEIDGNFNEHVRLIHKIKRDKIYRIKVK